MIDKVTYLELHVSGEFVKEGTERLLRHRGALELLGRNVLEASSRMHREVEMWDRRECTLPHIRRWRSHAVSSALSSFGSTAPTCGSPFLVEMPRLAVGTRAFHPIQLTDSSNNLLFFRK